MAQSALGTAGVIRRVGYGLEVGRSGRGGAYCVAQLVLKCLSVDYLFKCSKIFVPRIIAR